MAGFNEITANLWLQYTWRQYEGPNPTKWPSANEWEAQKQAEAAAANALLDEVRTVEPRLVQLVDAVHERFIATDVVRRQRAARAKMPRSTWPGWYEPGHMMAIALGAPEPQRKDNTWWHERDTCPLENIETAADLARLKLPDWSRLDCIQRMIDSHDLWQRERPNEPPAPFARILEHVAVPGREVAVTVSVPTFVDLGLYLMGTTHFLTILGCEPELADAFMEFCLELTVGYTEFLLSLHPVKFEGLTGFGGNATFFLSPDLYERYGAQFDVRLFDRFQKRYGLADNAPCNLHSCGASSHLYDNWGRHPRRANITCMQTRLIPGTVARLRAALPDTQLELTLHPPQFDLMRASKDDVREVMRQSAADVGGRNAHFCFVATVNAPEELPKLACNVEAVLEEMESIRR